jgi:hypothetical protein
MIGDALNHSLNYGVILGKGLSLCIRGCRVL